MSDVRACGRCGAELGELRKQRDGMYGRTCLNSECRTTELETAEEWRARLERELDEALERARVLIRKVDDIARAFSQAQRHARELADKLEEELGP